MISKALQEFIEQNAVSYSFPDARRADSFEIPIPPSEIKEELFDWFHGKLEARKYSFNGLFGMFPVEYNFVDRRIAFKADYAKEDEWKFDKLLIVHTVDTVELKIIKPTLKNAIRKLLGRKIPDDEIETMRLPACPGLKFTTKSKVEHATSTNGIGLCDSCGQLRPCMCGDFCPRCCSDVVEENNKITCTKCTWSKEL